ncbi:hypothetical protein MNBD_BACTEROID01-2801 [hydrothermal vent metagenome]|uniref:Uncharacterized protein n=1 Tax=hydrothermal vent metagenome TaxID=652676 RepID=A0A3B0TXQ7_9ZZZZ
MEDYIVILLILVFTVVGGLAQLKKKKNLPVANNAGSDDSETPDFWATLLGEQGMHQNQAAYGQAAYEQDSKEAEQKEEVTPKPMHTERFSSIRKRKMKQSDVIRQSEIGGEENKESLLADFSLRKAVIYSIIINRKYN